MAFVGFVIQYHIKKFDNKHVKGNMNSDKYRD